MQILTHRLELQNAYIICSSQIQQLRSYVVLKENSLGHRFNPIYQLLIVKLASEKLQDAI